ncbi:unnamed protein product [marine sediment metagenome]|uniref:Uncharacterized protein n=1 Tax=marine sediment metagenome TaxID=412755 RepID=X0VH66_9ZZZZ
MRHGAESHLKAVCTWAGLVILVLAVAPAAAETRVCVTSAVPEPFVMPDGLEYAPGNLRLCHGPEYSPSRMMHVGYVGRTPVGMLFSRRGLSEAPPDSKPFMVFSRDRHGRLRLSGFSVPGRDGMETFLLELPTINRAQSSKRVTRGA